MRLLVFAAFTAAGLVAAEGQSTDITAAERSADKRRTELLQRIAAVERSTKEREDAKKAKIVNLRGSATTKKATLLSTKSRVSTTQTATERADLAFVKEFTAKAAALSAETDDFLLNLDGGDDAGTGAKETAKGKHEDGAEVSSPKTVFGPNGCLATYKKGNSCWLEGRSCANAEILVYGGF